MKKIVLVTRLRLPATLAEELGMFSASAPQIDEHLNENNIAMDQTHEIVTALAEIMMMIAIATTVTTTTCATATGIEIETITAITIITDTNAKTRGIGVVRGTIALTLENASVIIVNTTDRTLTIAKVTPTATDPLILTHATITNLTLPILQQSSGVLCECKNKRYPCLLLPGLGVRRDEYKSGMLHEPVWKSRVS